VGRSGRSGHTVLFILNKIDNLAVTDDTYPEDVESAAEYFKDSLGSYIGKKFRAKLRIERVYFRQVDEIISSLDPEYTEDEGGQTVTAVFDVSDDTYLCKQIFPFGRNVEIIEPRELRETMVNLLKEGIAMYS
jgi:predicted DNA-binding transcriptional regulator YafY